MAIKLQLAFVSLACLFVVALAAKPYASYYVKRPAESYAYPGGYNGEEEGYGGYGGYPYAYYGTPEAPAGRAERAAPAAPTRTGTRGYGYGGAAEAPAVVPGYPYGGAAEEYYGR